MSASMPSHFRVKLRSFLSLPALITYGHLGAFRALRTIRKEVGNAGKMDLMMVDMADFGCVLPAIAPLATTQQASPVC